MAMLVTGRPHDRVRVKEDGQFRHLGASSTQAMTRGCFWRRAGALATSSSSTSPADRGARALRRVHARIPGLGRVRADAAVIGWRRRPTATQSRSVARAERPGCGGCIWRPSRASDDGN